MPNVVSTNHHHLWTDALHARTLAREANNRWDRGTYVRWCVVTAWTALEVACQDATGEPKISYSFKKNLAYALTERGFPPLMWGQGTWQKVSKVQELRKRFMHQFVEERDLFARVSVAEETVDTIRDAIKDIYLHLGQNVPDWITVDDERGWDKGSKSIAALTAIHGGVDIEAEDTIRVCYVFEGREFTSAALPSDADWKSEVEQLIKTLNVPASTIIVYQGSDKLHEERTNMRGA